MTQFFRSLFNWQTRSPQTRELRGRCAVAPSPRPRAAPSLRRRFMANGGRAQYLSQALQCGAVVCPDADTGVHRKPAVLVGQHLFGLKALPAGRARQRRARCAGARWPALERRLSRRFRWPSERSRLPGSLSHQHLLALHRLFQPPPCASALKFAGYRFKPDLDD